MTYIQKEILGYLIAIVLEVVFTVWVVIELCK